MSYVERRRFLWVLFLAGIALAAAVANSTTLARMSFDELAPFAETYSMPIRYLTADLAAWRDRRVWLTRSRG